MKKLLLLLLCVPLLTLAQQTYVPDDNFEQELINLGYDNVLDDYVQTSNIVTVTSLDVHSSNIADLTGIEEFTAIINPNDSCILAVGGIKNTPVVKNGEIVPGNIMKVTMSCDHRLVDGATGAKFLKTLKELLEDPIKILV